MNDAANRNEADPMILDELLATAGGKTPSADPMDDVPVDRQLFSVGYVAQLVQLPPRDVRLAARSAGVPVAYSLNDVAYYDGAGVVAINRFLRELRANSAMHKDS